MTENPHTKWTPRPPAPPEPKKPRRWFMWTFLVVQLLFVIWILTGIVTVSEGPGDCSGLDDRTCMDAYTTGAAIGFGFVLAIWAAVDLVLGLTYLIIRVNRKDRES